MNSTDSIPVASNPGTVPLHGLVRISTAFVESARSGRRKTFLCLLLAGLASLCMGPRAVAAEKESPGDWESLFNGKNLDGWAPVNEANFVVTNGNLRLVSGMGWLRTEKQYQDFILEVEWQALESGYDSGFFLRAGLEGKPWPNDGWQVNLARAALGALVKGTRTVVPAENPPAPLNKWVKFRIEVRGKKVTLDVDGERAWEYDGLDVTRGYLGIQAENKAFDFRSIRVKTLAN